MHKVALLVLFAACSVGEVPLEGGGTPDAQQMGPNQQSFDMIMKPLVMPCLGCHSTTQAPNLTSFDALQAMYKNKPGNTNILVTKGDALGGQHPQGIPYFNTDQKNQVTAWIDGLQ
jgi:hypothetical protein